ncbi:MAG: metal ABC transporter solute-binding protein, Zn/Mn family [Saprospiraceae bacterium]
MRTAIFLIGSLFLAFTNQAQDRLKVVATATMFEDMARMISGDLLEVVSIVPVGGDPHIYEPTPSDVSLVSDADLILRNGLTFEGWLDELIANSGTKAAVITVTNGITPIASNQYENATDPHAWMSAQNGLQYIENIRNALIRLDPQNEDIYTFNYRLYRQQLEDLDQWIRTEIEKIPLAKRVLITSHDAFRYFGKQYGVRVEAALGTSTDAEVQTSDIVNLSRTIRETGVPAIFVESSVNPKLLEQIARDNKVAIGGKLFSDSLGDKDSPAGSYTGMLRYNTETIVKALSTTVPETHADAASLNKSSSVWLWITLLALLIGGFAFVAFRLGRKKPIADGAPTITVEGLSVSYERKRVLSNIYLNIEGGKIYGVIGPNGAGKSTLFKSILGLIEPTAGNITIKGLPVKDGMTAIAYVPQKNDVDWTFPATVLDLTLMGRYPHKTLFQRLGRKDKELAIAALAQLGIEHLKNRQIGELSGGQQQRVFLARALCQEAGIFLLDEPFVGVDVTTEEKIIQILKGLAAEGKTLVVVHHDLSSVPEYFDEVILLNQRLIAAGPTETTFVKENIAQAYGAQLPVLHQTGFLE